MHSFPYFCLIKFCSGCFRQVFFSFGAQKEWLLVVLVRWLSYTVMIVWELAWVDSVLVVLGKWLSYKGGRISRFDCTYTFYTCKGKKTEKLKKSISEETKGWMN